MAKRKDYTLDWNKNQSVLIYDNAKKCDNNTIAHFRFNEDWCRYVDKTNFKEFDDWKMAVRNRIGDIIDWEKVELMGCSLTLKNIG